MSEKIDLTPLVNARQRLAEGLLRYEKNTQDDQIRDGLIQRFEFTYEISHKLLKRFLESASANPSQFDATPFSDQVRTANEQGLLLSDWAVWKRFREMRSKTSYTYSEAVAKEVGAGIPSFLAEVTPLLAELQNRTAR